MCFGRLLGTIYCFLVVTHLRPTAKILTAAVSALKGSHANMIVLINTPLVGCTL